MFERFTKGAQRVVTLAHEEARKLRQQHLSTEHLLLGLLLEDEGVAARVLRSLGLTVEGVRSLAVRLVGMGEGVSPERLNLTPRAKKILELTLREALTLGDNTFIGTEHFLLSLTRMDGGIARRILEDLDLDVERIRMAVIAEIDRASRSSSRDCRPAPLTRSTCAGCGARMVSDGEGYLCLRCGGTSPLTTLSPDVLVEELELGVRAYNCLKRAGAANVGDLVAMGRRRMRDLPNMNERSFTEVVARLEEGNIELDD